MYDFSFFSCIFLVLQLTHIFRFCLKLPSELIKCFIFVKFNISLFVTNYLTLVFRQFLVILNKHLELSAHIVDLSVLFGNKLLITLFLIRVRHISIHNRKIYLKLFVYLSFLGIVEKLVGTKSKMEILYTINYFFAISPWGKPIFCAYEYYSLIHGLLKILVICLKRITQKLFRSKGIFLQWITSSHLYEVACKYSEV